MWADSGGESAANRKSRHFGRTKEERKADMIASDLANALVWIENFDGDPDMILQAAKLRLSSSDKQGAKDALQALSQYYNE